MPNLQGQVALVTGAGRGIGRAISLALAAAGAHVVVSARTEAQIQQVAHEIRQTGAAATAVPADIGSPTDIERLFAQVDQSCGRLDILVNNAGLGKFAPILQTTADDFDAMYAVNLRGALLCCREALRRMSLARQGYILNISSVVGFKGYADQAAYAATKHGVMGLTKVLAVEAAPHQVRVSAILPGGVDTELVRAARPDLDTSSLMQPEDIAQTVMYLLSLSPRAAVDEIYIRRRNSSPF